MIKQLSKNNIIISPFNTMKSWELFNIQNEDVLLLEPMVAGSNIPDTAFAMDYVDYNGGSPLLNRECNLAFEQQSKDVALFEEGISGSGTFNSNDSQNYTGTYKHLLYTQIDKAFYNKYQNPLQIFGMENIDFPLNKTNRYLAEEFRLITIPQRMFGDKLVEGSIEFYDATFDDNVNIYDDKFGNLIAGNNLFSKVQEVRAFGNTIITGSDASYECPTFKEFITTFSSENSSMNSSFLYGSIANTYFGDNSNLNTSFNSGETMMGVFTENGLENSSINTNFLSGSISNLINIINENDLYQTSSVSFLNGSISNLIHIVGGNDLYQATSSVSFLNGSYNLIAFPKNGSDLYQTTSSVTFLTGICS
jgi:hypothetical protein